MVLIASPKVGVRRQWRKALQGMTPLQEVGARPALERNMAKLKPAVLLLDLAIPTLGGVGGVVDIQRLSPPTRIVLLSSTPDESEGVAALKVGARGYCHTDIGSGLAKKAVEMVQKGEIWVGRMFIPRLIEVLISLTAPRREGALANPDGRLAGLTSRQREVVRLIGGGAGNKEIARRLNIAERTVKAHLTNIFRKVGLSDRLHLALLVTERMPSHARPAPLDQERIGPRSKLPTAVEAS